MISQPHNTSLESQPSEPPPPPNPPDKNLTNNYPNNSKTPNSLNQVPEPDANNSRNPSNLEKADRKKQQSGEQFGISKSEYLQGKVTQ